MRPSPAPPGFYTVVDVTIRLTNDRILTYRWTTPQNLSRAFHKGPVWAKQEMRTAKVPGRSQIAGIRVEAVYNKGRYR